MVGHHTLNSQMVYRLKASVFLPAGLPACRSLGLLLSQSVGQFLSLSPSLSLSLYAFGFASVPAAAVDDVLTVRLIQMEVRVELFCVSVKCVHSI